MNKAVTAFSPFLFFKPLLWTCQCLLFPLFFFSIHFSGHGSDCFFGFSLFQYTFFDISVTAISTFLIFKAFFWISHDCFFNFSLFQYTFFDISVTAFSAFLPFNPLFLICRPRFLIGDNFPVHKQPQKLLKVQLLGLFGLSEGFREIL